MIGLFVIDRKINPRIVNPLFAIFSSIKFFSCSLTRKVYANGLVLFAITFPPFLFITPKISRADLFRPLRKLRPQQPHGKFASQIFVNYFRGIRGIPLTRRFVKSVFGKPNTFLAIMLKQPFYLIVFSCLLGVEKARQFITVGLSFPRF